MLGLHRGHRNDPSIADPRLRRTQSWRASPHSPLPVSPRCAPATTSRQLIVQALHAEPPLATPLHDGQIVVIAHKVVSKAEGAVVDLADVEPGARAQELAAEQGKDARAVQVVLDQSAEILRAANGVLISRTHHGFVCANAGVDASNAARQDGTETLIVLPRDPDASARRAARAPARADGRSARGADHRQLRPRLAPRAVRRGDRLRRDGARWMTGAGARTASAWSCAPPGSPSPTPPPPPPTSLAPRTRASPSC